MSWTSHEDEGGARRARGHAARPGQPGADARYARKPRVDWISAIYCNRLKGTKNEDAPSRTRPPGQEPRVAPQPEYRGPPLPGHRRKALKSPSPRQAARLNSNCPAWSGSWDAACWRRRRRRRRRRRHLERAAPGQGQGDLLATCRRVAAARGPRWLLAPPWLADDQTFPWGSRWGWRLSGALDGQDGQEPCKQAAPRGGIRVSI